MWLRAFTNNRLLFRIMPPGVIHAVFTLEDSIVIGGHFYSVHSFSRSLKAGLHEHICGQVATNTEHLASETLLYNLVVYYRCLYERIKEGEEIDQGACFFLFGVPDLIVTGRCNA